MSYQGLIDRIDSEKFDNINFFYGNESFLIETTVQHIIDKVIGPSKNSFNCETAYAKDITSHRIVTMAQTVPLLGKRRVVVIKDIHELKDLNEKGLCAYIESPSPVTYLIFTSSRPDKIHSKKKIYTALKKHGNTVEFKSLSDRQVVTWISRQVKKRQITIKPEASMYLVSSLENNLYSIDNELQKIITYIGDKKVITQKDVQAVIPEIDRKIDTIFRLTDSIGEKNIKNSLTCLHRLLRQGDSPQMILSMIARQLRLILLTKTLQEKKYPDKKIIEEAKIRSFLLKKLKAQAQKFTTGELENCFYTLLNVDLSLKTTASNATLAIESFIVQICTSRQYI